MTDSTKPHRRLRWLAAGLQDFRLRAHWLRTVTRWISLNGEPYVGGRASPTCILESAR